MRSQGLSTLLASRPASQIGLRIGGLRELNNAILAYLSVICGRGLALQQVQSCTPPLHRRIKVGGERPTRASY